MIPPYRRSLALGAALALVATSLTGCFSSSRTEAVGDRSQPLVAEPGYIVVDFVDGTLEADFDQWEQAWGVDVEFNSVVGAESGVTIAKVSDVAAALKAIRGHEAVEDAEPLIRYRTSGFTPDDPGYAKQWHFEKVGAEQAWAHSRGAGVVVAVIDTGVAQAEFEGWAIGEDLADARFVAGYDFVNDRAEVIDDNGHGTHVAGTIAEVTHNGTGAAGLAFDAKIMPLKVLAAQGWGNSADIADAIRFAADNGAKVINMSLGGGGFSEVMNNAVQYARDKGVLVVAAAGNERRGEVSFPAGYEGVVSVSATRYDDQLAPYSNFGQANDIAAPGGDKSVDQNKDGFPDGVYQNTIDPRDPKATRYDFFQGTSMAAPHVAAGAALVMSTGLTEPDAVKAVLFETARKVPAMGDAEWTPEHGHGVIDAAKAAETARTQLGLGRLATLLGLFALFWLGRRRSIKLGAGFGLAGLWTGAGFFFLPSLVGSFPGSALLHTPLMDWGMHVFGAAGHANIATWSVGLPLLAVGLLLGMKSARPLIGGVAVGGAAFLLHGAVVAPADVAWMPGQALDAVWLGLNGLGSLAIAWLVTRREGLDA